MTATKEVVKTPQQLVIEEWLDGYSVEWDFRPEFLFSKIDLVSSLKNQARINVPLDEARVELIAEAMEEGEEVPPVIGYMKNGKLILIDGNHRVNAWSLFDLKKIPVYVVEETDLDVITEMTYQANAKHATPNSPEERLQHAMWLVQQGKTQIEAAALMNVKRADLNGAWKKAEVDRRALALGVNKREWAEIASSSRIRLTAIKNDAAFLAAIEVVAKTKLPSKEVGELVTDINRKRTNDSQMKVVDAFKKSHIKEIKANRRGPRSLSYMVMTHSTGLLSVLSRDDFYDNITPAAAKEYIDKLQEVIAVAAVASNELKKYV